MEEFSQLSDEMVRVAVWAHEEGEQIDPSEGTTLTIAFSPASMSPQPSDFQPGVWEYDQGFFYACRSMVDLLPGKYAMWIKLEGGVVHPETPVIRSRGLFKVV